jgi:ATP adenylyltransferase
VDSSKTRKGKKEILWAPWRMEYIENCDRSEGCIFCETQRENRDRENLIVFRSTHAFIIMNRYPYNNGHLMAVPFRHTCDLGSLNREEQSDLFNLLILSQKVLDSVMHPHGYNVGMNLGRISGAGIADHLHFHLVPRWDGDTNFMPIIGHTKVVSEGLDSTWEKLNREILKQI